MTATRPYVPVPCIHGHEDYRLCLACQRKLTHDRADTAKRSRRRVSLPDTSASPEPLPAPPPEPVPASAEAIAAARQAAAQAQAHSTTTHQARRYARDAEAAQARRAVIAQAMASLYKTRSV
ncbi:hypothetical protein [Actinomyces faecalis]|uniref:hypothetical protein n=1 Tax=Actinomyces faecalis TaxID=2722820 RepID=UPI001553E278|nr:hypothetical protein [Actinomyces faecalis]